MATGVTQGYQVPGPYDEDYRSLARREQMAQILQQQAFQPIDVGSYQGIQAPISPLSGIAKVLQGYFAGQQMDAADKGRKDLELKSIDDQYRMVGLPVPDRTKPQALAQALAQPATPSANYGEGMPSVVSAPQAANMPQAETMPVAQSFPIGPSGATQNLPNAQLAQALQAQGQPQGQPQVQPQGVPQQVGKPMIPLINGDPQQTMALMRIIGVPETVKAALANAAPSDFSKIVAAAGIQQGSPEWNALHAAQVKNKNYTAPVKVGANETVLNPYTNQPVYTPPDKTAPQARSKTLGELDAKQIDALHLTAQDSQKMVTDANRIIDLIDQGAFTGAGANVKLEIARGFNLMGANNDEAVKNGELLVSQTAGNVLNHAKTSGLGTGQGFTDKDRDFLEKVVGGKITLNGETLKELARIQKQVASTSVEKWNSTYNRLPENDRGSRQPVKLIDVTRAQAEAEARRRGLIQ